MGMKTLHDIVSLDTPNPLWGLSSKLLWGLSSGINLFEKVAFELEE